MHLLRRYLHEGEDFPGSYSRVMSSQAANVCITLDRRAGEGMEEILPRVIRETKLLKGNSIGISEQVRMEMAFDPGCYMPSTCFVTSTFRGHMTITMGFQDSKRARGVTRKAMDLFRQYLLL